VVGGFTTETCKGGFCRAIGIDGGGDGGVGYASEEFMELFAGCNGENIVRESDSVFIVAAVSSCNDP
jgi:hypothetical protein